MLSAPAPVEARDHTAVRSFDVSEVALGGTVTVTIEARGFGRFGRVSETLPDGWTYESSTLPDPAVSVEGSLVRFIVIGDGAFSYTVTAPDAEGTYAFSGRIEDSQREAVTVGGDHEVTARYEAPAPVVIEVRVLQDALDEQGLRVAARRAGDSRQPALVPVPLDDGSSFFGRYRYGDLALEAPSQDDDAAAFELRLSQAVAGDRRLFVSARSAGESWLRLGMVPLPPDDGDGATRRIRFWRIDLDVPSPDARAQPACSSGLAVPEPELHPELVRDCAVLLQERDALAGGADGLDWSTERPIGDWHGITVGGEPRRVTGISIDSVLQGRIPPGLARLDGLVELRLPDNELTGGIPRELGLLPDLRVIDFSRSALSGRIPAELGLLVELRELLVPGNRLTGAIPAELAALVNLQALSLAGNELTGTIPPGLGTLAGLGRLEVDGNRLEGCIPDGLERFDFEIGESGNPELRYCPDDR